MIALLGSPPKSFLEDSPNAGDYFDKNGKVSIRSKKFKVLARTNKFQDIGSGM